MTSISLVISDVDGTLVTPDKLLTDANVRAVKLLRDRNIGFTINTSRPPMGVRMLIEPLSLELPIGAFNGGAVVGPDLKVIEQHLVPEPALRRTVEVLTAVGIDVWAFTAESWLVRNPAGDLVARERETIQAEPTAVADFEPYVARVSKIVGASMDFARLAQCEASLRATLRGQASVVRSQPYYLDITAPHVDKGSLVDVLCRRLSIAPMAIAALGDMENDLAMFRKVGPSIAMGNASAEVKGQANYTTASNGDNGFAQAVERYILGYPNCKDC